MTQDVTTPPDAKSVTEYVEKTMQESVDNYAQPVSPWQDIATAPKDGTSILIYLPKYERQPVCEASWAYDYEGAEGYWTTPYGPTERGYQILPEAPTHWMPLPPPPEASHE